MSEAKSQATPRHWVKARISLRSCGLRLLDGRPLLLVGRCRRRMVGQSEFGENLLVVLAERGRRRIDARPAMGKHEGRERHADPARYSPRRWVAVNDAARH